MPAVNPTNVIRLQGWKGGVNWSQSAATIPIDQLSVLENGDIHPDGSVGHRYGWAIEYDPTATYGVSSVVVGVVPIYSGVNQVGRESIIVAGSEDADEDGRFFWKQEEAVRAPNL